MKTTEGEAIKEKGKRENVEIKRREREEERIGTCNLRGEDTKKRKTKNENDSREGQRMKSEKSEKKQTRPTTKKFIKRDVL